MRSMENTIKLPVITIWIDPSGRIVIQHKDGASCSTTIQQLQNWALRQIRGSIK